MKRQFPNQGLIWEGGFCGLKPVLRECLGESRSGFSFIFSPAKSLWNILCLSCLELLEGFSLDLYVFVIFPRKKTR
jgi:hypothetical protein